MRMQLNKILLVFVASAFLLSPFVVSAAGLVPCGGGEQQAAENVTNAPKTTPGEVNQALLDYQAASCNLRDLAVLVARVVNFMIGFSGLYAVFKILESSFKLVIAAGSEEQITSGRKGLTHAIVGLAIVFLAYLAVNTIFAIFAPKFGVSQSGFLYNPFK